MAIHGGFLTKTAPSKAGSLLDDLDAFAKSDRDRVRILRCSVCALEPEQRAAIESGLAKGLACNLIARWWSAKFPDIRLTRSMIENHVRNKHEDLRKKSK